MINEKWLNDSGIRTRYLEAGSGDRTVVLIHGGLFSKNGLCMSAVVWEATIRYLAREFRVYALDTLGQGRTDFPTRESEFTIGGMINHLRGFLDSLELKRPHLVGHDEGAMLAVRLAFAEPGRIASCSIVDSAAVAPVGDGLYNSTLDSPLQPLFSAASQRWILDQCLYNHQPILTERFIEEATAIAATSAFIRWHDKATVDEDFQSRIALELADLRLDNFARWRDQDWRTPVQLVWGYQDPISLVQYAEALHSIVAERAGIAQLKFINRTGYLPFVKEPHAFAEIVGSFVRSTN
jgi:pimeloyl-ACP methyl ester carboxylesterase